MTSDGGAAAARAALLRIEGRLAIVINAAISIGFFLLIFGWHAAIARALALDFVPQTLGITVLGGVVPALIMRRRLRSGGILPAGPAPTVPALLIRIGGVALVALIVLALPAGLLLIALAPETVAPWPAVIVKTIYGGTIGYLMTLPILRMTLGMPAWTRARAKAA